MKWQCALSVVPVYVAGTNLEANFTFKGQCIVNVFKYNQQDATLHNDIYYYKTLHVSGGSSAHHEELKNLYTTSGICRAVIT